jgi:hypothetical protein
MEWVLAAVFAIAALTLIVMAVVVGFGLDGIPSGQTGGAATMGVLGVLALLVCRDFVRSGRRLWRRGDGVLTQEDARLEFPELDDDMT